MQLRKLSHLVALADQGSFGRAAEAVHLSQPALSRSIDSLEEDLGARLVDRAYGQVRLTAAGELVLTRARHLLADAQLIQRDVLLLQGLAIGRLQVGLGPFPAALLGQPVLSRLVQQHPQLAVQLNVADPESLCEQLNRQELDLFVADTRTLKKRPGLQLKRLPNVAVAFFVRASHPLLALGEPTLDQAMDYPVGSPNLPGAIARHFEDHVSRTDRPLFSVVCNDMSTLRQLALTANAVILAPDAAGLNHSTEFLVRLPVRKLGTMLTHYSLVTLAQRTMSPAARAFVALLHEMMVRGEATDLVATKPLAAPRRAQAPSRRAGAGP